MTWTALEEYDDNGTIYYAPPGEGLSISDEPDSVRGVTLTVGKAYQCRGASPFVATVVEAYPYCGELLLSRPQHGVDWSAPIDSGLELSLTVEELDEESREE